LSATPPEAIVQARVQHRTAPMHRTTDRATRAPLAVRGRNTCAGLLPLALLAGACSGPSSRLPEPQRHQVESARAVPLEAHRTTERRLDLALDGTQPLVLREHYGDVIVTADADGPPRCHAVIEISAADAEAANALERTIGIVARPTEAGLQIELAEPLPDEELVFASSASLEIFVPPGTPLDLQLVRGSLNGIGPFGRAQVETGKGDLRLRRVDGGVIARSNAGDVKLRMCTGGPVRASTDVGMIALLGSPTETARLETGRGRVVVNTAGGGTFDVVARQGTVRLVSVDASVALEADEGVHVEEFEGDLLQIDKRGGSTRLDGVRAGRVVVRGEEGGAELEGVSADEVEVEVEAGEVVLTDVGGRLRVRTGDGDIDAALLRGPLADLATRLGAVRVEGATGRLETRTERGRTQLRGLECDVSARSAQGAIQVVGVLGSLLVEGAEGGVHVRALDGSRPRETWRLSSGRGDLVINVPPELAFLVQAQAEAGVIDSAFPIVVGAGVPQQGDTLRGEVNGGGPRIELHSAAGNIALRRQR